MAKAMINALHQWATAWGVPAHAVHDLLLRLGMGFEPVTAKDLTGYSEAAVQNVVRLDAAKEGIICWRNNVGALRDDTGRVVRYGLCNDTKQLNENIKSADLIGIKPTLITPQLLGHTVGVFWSMECKEYGWRFTGSKHELAQQRWAQRVISLGGIAGFSTGAI